MTWQLSPNPHEHLVDYKPPLRHIPWVSDHRLRYRYPSFPSSLFFSLTFHSAAKDNCISILTTVGKAGLQGSEALLGWKIGLVLYIILAVASLTHVRE